ncbi:MAG: 3'(2'),5'-bisphosphate nucleotidase CysQ [Rhizobiaceae bacterium]
MQITKEECAELARSLIPVAKSAGAAIMDVYNEGPSADQKSDGSPVTEADLRAEKIILEGLAQYAPDISIVSEESAQSHDAPVVDLFFLVDPLDGTREFIKADGKGAFTVNIGLVHKGQPIMGIVYAPALNDMYWGVAGFGAFHNGNPIHTRQVPQSGAVALASASHRDETTDEWLNRNKINKTISIGSSLKFCLVARGEADFYPRFGPTMEWDTAAGHAVLSAAGGRVTHPEGEDFTYGKAAYRNSAFIGVGI